MQSCNPGIKTGMRKVQNRNRMNSQLRGESWCDSEDMYILCCKFFETRGTFERVEEVDRRR